MVATLLLQPLPLPLLPLVVHRRCPWTTAPLTRRRRRMTLPRCVPARLPPPPPLPPPTARTSARRCAAPTGVSHSSEQVLLLEDHELWDTMAENWCQPGAEKISAIVDTWEGRDLAACVHRLGLPVIYAKKNYQLHMRKSVVDAVRRHAQLHPELFAAGAEDSAEGSESEPQAERAQVSPPPPRSAPLQRAPAAPDASPAPPAQGRRSPRAPASSRSAAAMAAAALQQLPAVDAAVRRSPARSVRPAAEPRLPHLSGRARSAVLAADLHLHGAGGGNSDASLDDAEEDGDSDWSPSADPLAASLRHGGRMQPEEIDHQLAQAGVQRAYRRRVCGKRAVRCRRPLHVSAVQGSDCLVHGRVQPA